MNWEDYDYESTNDKLREVAPDECKEVWIEFVKKLIFDVKSSQKDLFGSIGKENLEIYDEDIDYINDTDADIALFLWDKDGEQFSVDMMFGNDWSFTGEYDEPEYFKGDAFPYYSGGWHDIELDIKDDEYNKVLEDFKKELLGKVKEHYGINECFKGQPNAAKRLLQMI